MTRGLHRYYGAQDLHFITGSCYRREPELGTPPRRDLFLQILEQVRKRYGFVVLGYVIMPEHFHLLISEPEKGTPSTVMQVLKQRFSRRVRRRSRYRSLQPTLWTADSEPDPDIWQKRFYDFNVWSERKRIEKLRYMHRNPVKRGLISQPDLWIWSSFRGLRLRRSRSGADQPMAGAQAGTRKAGRLMEAADTHFLQKRKRWGTLVPSLS